ncbi:MAG: CvpA family protein [Verrucomicrobia bacterium]|nr:CvpA family protein [Verrucomicrobiota bacterium]MDE3098288.1 CvpA family protein [Verrucomicrobiota bacterium]
MNVKILTGLMHPGFYPWGMIAGAPVAFALPFNWFDLVVVAALGVGIALGRHNGMSKETLPLLQWLSLVFGPAFGYSMAGKYLIAQFHWSRLACFIAGYLAIAAVILMVFSLLRSRFGERMGQSHIFKSTEFYLGMLSGMVRVGCMLILALALLHAPVYSSTEIEAQEAYQKQTWGGGLYSGTYFPTIHSVQESVFDDSFTGPLVAKHLRMLLIDSDKSSDASQPAT